MNNIQLNINNLTQLWKSVGQAFNAYFKEEHLCCVTIKNTDWPNRIWIERPISAEIIQGITLKMSKDNSLTFSYFDKEDNINEWIKNSQLRIKSKQFGMYLDLNEKFDCEKDITLLKLTNKEMAVLWSKSFYEAFNYKISTETVFMTKEIFQYFLVYENNDLVGTVMTFEKEKVLGIHCLGVLPAQRNKGFAMEVMHKILNNAIEQNLDLVVLQASEMAVPMYKKLGFNQQFIMYNLKYNEYEMA